jgi:hypothetical protein
MNFLNSHIVSFSEDKFIRMFSPSIKNSVIHYQESSMVLPADLLINYKINGSD